MRKQILSFSLQIHLSPECSPATSSNIQPLKSALMSWAIGCTPGQDSSGFRRISPGRRTNGLLQRRQPSPRGRERSPASWKPPNPATDCVRSRAAEVDSTFRPCGPVLSESSVRSMCGKTCFQHLEQCLQTMATVGEHDTPCQTTKLEG